MKLYGVKNEKNLYFSPGCGNSMSLIDMLSEGGDGVFSSITEAQKVIETWQLQNFTVDEIDFEEVDNFDD